MDEAKLAYLKKVLDFDGLDLSYKNKILLVEHVVAKYIKNRIQLKKLKQVRAVDAVLKEAEKLEFAELAKATKTVTEALPK